MQYNLLEAHKALNPLVVGLSGPRNNMGLFRIDGKAVGELQLGPVSTSFPVTIKAEVAANVWISTRIPNSTF